MYPLWTSINQEILSLICNLLVGFNKHGLEKLCTLQTIAKKFDSNSVQCDRTLLNIHKKVKVEKFELNIKPH